MNWWNEYYDAKYIEILGYERFYRGTEKTAAELAMLATLLPPAPAKILDAGCGWGRHSIGLAKQGYTVLGLDQSPSLLAKAQEMAQAQEVAVDFMVGEHLSHRWVDEFDAIINMSTAFGYYPTPEENQQVLEAWYEALHDGGRLIMELGHRDQIVRSFKSSFWREHEDKTIWRVSRHFDPIAGINHVKEHWRTADGREGERQHSIYLYNATELARMLKLAGFTPLHWYGEVDLRPFTHESRQLIMVAQK